MRLTPEQRRLIEPAVDRVNNKSLVAKTFGVSRKTVYKWNKRRKHLEEKEKKAKKTKGYAKDRIIYPCCNIYFSMVV